MGFWPGGDRDGNPFVTAEITAEVGRNLRKAILRCYYRDVRALKRRLTFAGVDVLIAKLERDLYGEAFQTRDCILTQEIILQRLSEIHDLLIAKHNGLFVYLVGALTKKVGAFGTFFASIDIRQDSSVHAAVLETIAAESDRLPDNYATLSDSDKASVLLNVKACVDPAVSDETASEALRVALAMRQIRSENGREGCERYVISHCESSLDVLEVYGLLLLGGFSAGELDIDIVPLFETIDDLKNSSAIMRELYEIPEYRQHLLKRGNRQTVMLGFSDGTKDGGYLMANWSIYKAKDALTTLSREFGIDVIFFDGRGGPPARGGGKTHKFYSSMGQNIQGDAIQLTIQGQTVRLKFRHC